MDLRLGGKVAIVTGGSRGIGKAIARTLAREGAAVAIVARTPESLEAAAAELRQETGGTIVAVPADTAADASVRTMVAEVVRQLGGVDVLVNCGAAVGQSVASTLSQLQAETFFNEMNVKVLGYLRCIREVAPHMQAKGWGRIVNISGLAARQPTSIVGSARNASVVAMAKNVARELGPHGITVTTVHPSGTLTERYAAQVDALMAQHGITREEALKRRFGPNFIGRPVHVEEIAAVVAFLASDYAATLTGEVIAMSGGDPHSIVY